MQPSIQSLLPSEYTHAFDTEALEHPLCTEALVHPHTKLLQHNLYSKGLDNSQTTAYINPLEHTLCTKGLEHSYTPDTTTLEHIPLHKGLTTTAFYTEALQPPLNVCTNTPMWLHSHAKYLPWQLRHLIRAYHLNSKPRTPLNLHVLQKELMLHPVLCTLIHNLEHGCDIGYTGSQFTHSSSNLPSSFQNRSILDANITEECNMGCMLGPYKTPPLLNFCCSAWYMLLSGLQCWSL